MQGIGGTVYCGINQIKSPCIAQEIDVNNQLITVCNMPTIQFVPF